MNPGPLARALWWCADRYEAVTTRLIAARGLAVLRIGYGTLWVLFLLREWVERDAAWGPGSAWSPALDREYAAGSGWSGFVHAWFTAIAALTRTEFDLCYLAAIAIGVAFALGWHTRVVSVLFALFVVALENRAPLLTDGGDNVLMLMSIYLAFTACGTYWSLDARRRAAAMARAAEHERGDADRSDWRAELAEARRRMAIIVHNGAVLVIAAQICVVYGTAGFLKVQGSMWQDGSALGYVLRLNWFHPWPGLSAWLAGHTIAIAIAGYVTVFVQAGFPFIVFSPRLKYPALAVLVGMHASIAILLGLPFFSAIMLVGDAIFLPDRFWAAVGRSVLGPAYALGMRAVETSAVEPSTGEISTGRKPVTPRPTLVFDGDCGFCTASVHVLESWCRPDVRFVPWQMLDLAAHGLTERQVSKAVQWLPISADAPIRPGAAAVARVLLRSRWPWRPIGALLLVPPISWLAAGAYHVISANRYRLPGSTPACAVAAQNSRTDQHGHDGESGSEGGQSQRGGSAQRLGDLGGGAHDAGAGAGRVELAERDHAD
ncbi:MAG TPA: DCC1-like thiol-disulfide oxidoreductase family protein [Actinocrinis sp.]|nr:DCC1-like thiol-disulfide oxidoreductase family protein [Actinocrinis sp.]